MGAMLEKCKNLTVLGAEGDDQVLTEGAADGGDRGTGGCAGIVRVGARI